MGIMADPSNLSQYILDMFHRIMALLQEAIEFFETLVRCVVSRMCASLLFLTGFFRFSISPASKICAH